MIMRFFLRALLAILTAVALPVLTVIYSYRWKEEMAAWDAASDEIDLDN